MRNKSSFFQNLSNYSQLQIVGPMEFDLELLNHSLPCLFVDGGAKFSKKFPRKQCYLCGDGDSLQDPELFKTFDTQWSTDKKFSDLEGALKLISQNSFENILIYGFQKGDFDHQIFNLGCFHQYVEQTKTTTLTVDKQLHVIPPGIYSFNAKDTFSIWSLESLRLQMTGACQFPVTEKQQIAPLSSLTLSNSAHGVVKIHTDKTAFLYFRNEEVDIQREVVK